MTKVVGVFDITYKTKYSYSYSMTNRNLKRLLLNTHKKKAAPFSTTF